MSSFIKLQLVGDCGLCEFLPFFLSLSLHPYIFCACNVESLGSDSPTTCLLQSKVDVILMNLCGQYVNEKGEASDTLCVR